MMGASASIPLSRPNPSGATDPAMTAAPTAIPEPAPSQPRVSHDSIRTVRASRSHSAELPFIHLKDGSAGSYEVKRQSQQKVLELLQPVATQLGIRIGEEAGVLPDSRLHALSPSGTSPAPGYGPATS